MDLQPHQDDHFRSAASVVGASLQRHLGLVAIEICRTLELSIMSASQRMARWLRRVATEPDMVSLCQDPVLAPRPDPVLALRASALQPEDLVPLLPPSGAATRPRRAAGFGAGD